MGYQIIRETSTEQVEYKVNKLIENYGIENITFIDGIKMQQWRDGELDGGFYFYQTLIINDKPSVNVNARFPK